MGVTFASLRNAFRVSAYYARALPAFVGCLLDPNLSLKFGRYTRFGGESLPYFFSGKNIPLSRLRISNSEIEDTRSYQRVVEILKNYPTKPEGPHFMGRDVERIWDLVEARMTGSDSFTVLVERTSQGNYSLIDGTTRVSLLAATGAKTTPVFVTLRRA
jgi:hypothetical protein